MTKEFEKFLSLIKCKVVCIYGGEPHEYDNGKDVLDHIENSYDIESIYIRDEAIVISFLKSSCVLNDLKTEWAQEYKSENGAFPNIFDGS